MNNQIILEHGSLFSGGGGFDLAAEWLNWQNVFHCEINPFGQTILKYYFPNATSYTDITKTDFTKHRGAIDILTGGFPCQPFSVSGKRKGIADKRHLWPEMLRAIKEIQPPWIVGENVYGLINWNRGMVFDQVQTDLETEGYEVWPYVLPACAVNAPHRRDRVWFVAYSDVFRQKRYGSASHDRCQAQSLQKEKQERERLWNDTGRNDAKGIAANTNSKRLQERPGNAITTEQGQFSRIFRPKYWADFPTQSPVCRRNDGLSARMDGITFSKWKKESIKLFGNAIVPQEAYEIFKTIVAYIQQEY